jgi:polysaccharide deacetylase family protein (PEP-CTERM system associated)
MAYFKNKLYHAMSVDIEEYYQVSAFEKILSEKDFESLPKRASYATHLLLDLFFDKNVKATFFTLSNLAKNEKSLIKRIINEGHELASHGVKHDRVRNLTAEQFFNDIYESKQVLEDISGVRIIGYRAPSFSIGQDTPWAYDMLIKAGYQYSSSIHPIKHDHYGDANAPLDIHKPILNENFYEFPITVLELGQKRLPIGGGGWFRLMPFWLYRRLLHKAVNSNRPMIFYTHPWEYDADQPVIKGLPLKTRFRHYVNLSRTHNKLSQLLELYNWTRCDNIIGKIR